MISQKLTADKIIQVLNLQPLPVEGGFYHQTYRTAENIPADMLPGRYPRVDKPFGTAIFYLLTAQPYVFSAFHRLATDEVFHFYLGDPLEITLLQPDGSSQQVILGSDILAGQQVQFVVPHGVWQGTRVAPGGEFALIGTTMAPGYTDSDYEHGNRADLLVRYPHEQERILALTGEE